MSFIGANPRLTSTKYTPQSADPVSTYEGQVFRSDGTVRAKGLWEFRDGVFKRVGGGSGELNFYENGDADNHTDTTNFTTGNNATFDGGGTVQGVFSISSTAADVINGDKVFKLVLHATPGTSDDDYVASQVIDIPQGYRGRDLAVKLQYKYDGADDDVKWVVKDQDNTVILSIATDLMEQSAGSDDIAKEFQISVFVPSDVSQIKIGPQVVIHATGSEVLIWDDAIVSPNPFIFQDLTDSQDTTFAAAASTMTTTSGDLRWSSVTQSGSSLLVYTDANGRLTAQRDKTRVNVHSSLRSASANNIDIQQGGSVVNSSDIDAGEHGLIGASLLLDKDEYITINSSASLDSAQIQYLTVSATAESQAIVTPAKSTLSKWIAYTPTTQGLGTVTAINMEFREVGTEVQIRGHLTTGTTTASEAQVGLPSIGGTQLTVNGPDSSTFVCGHGLRGTVNTQSMVSALGTEGDAFLNFSLTDNSTDALVPVLGSGIAGSTERLSFHIRVDINELDAESQFLALIPQDFFQSQQLASDVTASSTLFTWSNLVIGRTYEIEMQLRADVGLNSTMDAVIKHNSLTEGRATMVERTSATTFAFFGKAKFVAATTTATVEWVEGGSVTVFGDTTKDETFTRIKECNSESETTIFT